MPGLFAKDVRRFADEAVQKNRELMGAAAMAAFLGTIRSTPVREGRLRANWQVTGSGPSNRPPSRQTGDPSSRVSVAVDRITTAGGNAWFLTNNLPYAEVVEFGGYPVNLNTPTDRREVTVFGYSKQAPAGMLRINFRRVAMKLPELAERL